MSEDDDDGFEIPNPFGMVDTDNEFTNSTTTEKEENEKSSNDYYDNIGQKSL